MTRALLLIMALTYLMPALAASSSGTIAVSLVIQPRCDISRAEKHRLPAANCGGHSRAQPRITQQTLQQDPQRHETTRLTTVEW